MDNNKDGKSRFGNSDPKWDISEELYHAWQRKELTDEQYFRAVALEVGRLAYEFKPLEYTLLPGGVLHYLKDRRIGAIERNDEVLRAMTFWVKCTVGALEENKANVRHLLWAYDYCYETKSTREAKAIKDVLALYYPSFPADSLVMAKDILEFEADNERAEARGRHYKRAKDSN